MRAFFTVLMVVIFGVANAFFILNSKRVDLKKGTAIYDGGIYMSLIYTYRTALGDFQTDNIEKGGDVTLLWWLFIFITVFLQITMFNLLISILGETFGAVTSMGDKSAMQEICSMINENEFIMNREEVFKNSKYIIVARTERAGVTEND